MNLVVAVLLQQKAGLFLAHPDIVCSREHINQLEVLVDHADAQFLGVLGRIDGHFPAVYKNLTRIRLVDAGEHVHQSGLAGTVLSQQGQNLTGTDLQIDCVVGNHRAEALGDATHFNGVLLLHGDFLLI